MTATENKKARSAHQPLGCWIRPQKRLAIYLRDKFTCAYCNRQLHDAAPDEITLDHLIPKSEGGSNHESNLTTACKICNCTRKDMKLQTFASKSVVRAIALRAIKNLTPYKVLAKSILEGRVSRVEACEL